MPSLLRRTFAWIDFADLIDGWTPPARAGLREVVAEATLRRSEVTARASADILDPFQAKVEVFERMARAVEGSLDPIVAALDLN